MRTRRTYKPLHGVGSTVFVHPGHAVARIMATCGAEMHRNMLQLASRASGQFADDARYVDDSPNVLGSVPDKKGIIFADSWWLFT